MGIFASHRYFTEEHYPLPLHLVAVHDCLSTRATWAIQEAPLYRRQVMVTGFDHTSVFSHAVPAVPDVD